MMAVTSFASGSDLQKGKFSGEYEDYVIGTRKSNKFRVTERTGRLKLSYELNSAEASVSYLTAPQFHSQQLHESFVGYKAHDFTLRVGPMMIPVGQSTWDDQWYDAANAISSTEYWPHIKGVSLLSTVPSLAAVRSRGPDQLAVSVFGTGNYKNKFVPTDFQVAAVRFQHYVGNSIIGVSTAQDFENRGRDADLYCIDIRHTVPHLVSRAELTWSKRPNDRSKSGFAAFTYRPAHWTDASLFFRYQFLNAPFGFRDQRETLGAKLRAPLDFTVNVNYVFMPHMGKPSASGTGWSIQLYRVYRF